MTLVERVMSRWVGLGAWAAVLCLATVAEAQTRPLPSSSPKRWEFGGGMRWTTAVTFDSADANERDPTGAPFRLFAVKTQLENAFGAHVYIAPRITRSLRLEVSGSYAAPQLSASVTHDVENADDVLIDETITQLAMDVALLYEFHNDRTSRPNVPFIMGGGGFSRELHDGQTLIETGQSFFAGVGLKGYFMRGQVRRSIGLRFDGRAVFKTNGVALDDQTHIGAVLTASVFKQF
jgi:hypothetical protein